MRNQGSPRAPNNRTVRLEPSDIGRSGTHVLNGSKAGSGTLNRMVSGDAFEILPRLGPERFDLLFADPPYNLTKDFGTEKFRETSVDAYEAWLESWISLCVPLLKPTASVYICGDWRSSGAIQRVGTKYFTLRNRITWEREGFAPSEQSVIAAGIAELVGS